MAGLVPAIHVLFAPPEGWGWCYVDEQFVDLPTTTKQVGPIKRWV